MSLPFIDALKFAKQVFDAEEEETLIAEHAFRRNLPAAMRHINPKVTWDGDIHLDYEAIGELLRERCAPEINELAAQIAAKVDVGSVDAPVTVLSTTTDRAIAIIAIAHPAGEALQAKYGSLTKAAAACGYEVKSK